MSFIGDIKYSLDKDVQADITIQDADVLQDETFETAVLISLFSNARADKDDVLPDKSGDKGGWWGSSLLPPEIKFFGSKIWLLSRSKITDEVLEKLKQYIQESLKWMITAQITNRIEVDITRYSKDTILFDILIMRGIDEYTSFKYYYNWESQMLGRI